MGQGSGESLAPAAERPVPGETGRERVTRHRQVSSWLESQPDEALAALAPTGGTRNFWSTWGVIRVAGHEVFVKRIPLTAREVAAPYSTGNHFGLPSFYQYGVGSAGFGAFRELAALETATSWVLAGRSSSFPLLHHHRILPGQAGAWPERMSPEEYVSYWAGHPGVADLVRERRAADHELWLFLEHFPWTVGDWLLLPGNQAQVELVIDQLASATADLRRHGLVHFDAHLANALTDGDTVYLADFGLACSPEFDLSPDEERFLGRHPHYDLGIALAYLSLMLAFYVQGQPADLKSEVDRACGISEGQGRLEVILGLVEGCQRVAEIVGLAPEYVRAIEQYRDVGVYVHEFVTQLQTRPEKDATYNDSELLARLRAAGAAHLD